LIEPSAEAGVSADSWTVRGTLALALLCSVQFMLILDLTIVNVALPSIQRAMGGSREDLQWVVSGYALSFGGFLMLAGRAADLYGRRRFFMLGLALFAVASLAGGLSHSVPVLIAARLMQGLGGALVSPAALSLLTTTFGEGAERNRALAVWGAVAAAGGAVGLLLSGIITDILGWSWVFFLNVPIAVLAIALSPVLLPESQARGASRRLDVAGAVSVTLGSLLLVFGLSQVATAGPLSVRTLAPLLGAVVAFAGFFAIENRTASPLVPLEILRRRTLSGANVVILLLTAVVAAQGFYSTFYLQQVLGFSAIATGLSFLPIALVIMVFSTLSPRLAYRYGTRRMLIVGMLVITVSMLYFVRLPQNATYFADLLPGFLGLAVGMGLSFFSATVAATTGVADHQQGVASGLINTSSQVGSALGLAVLISIGAGASALVTSGGETDPSVSLLVAFRTAHAFGAILAAIAALVAIFAVRPEPSSD
jgi:EmrB/QacA subfamily drug resistance transporter